MYCCLFKKVTVHNSSKISRLSCNRNTHCIGIGGTEGFVKVVKIDLINNKPDSTGKVNPLTFTQNLVSHKKKILTLTWNDSYEKLTTADEEGIIIVWKFENNQWVVEMVNNREISFVSDIKWNKQGTFLCFVYDDGHAIVGTVDGSRCWGNDIKDKIYLIEWSPDSSLILFVAINSNVIVFSSSGYQIGEIDIATEMKPVKISTITWWSNPFSEDQTATILKHLCIAFSNGWVYLYDDPHDLKPLKFKTEFNNLLKADWNPHGDVLAIGGTSQDQYETRYSVNFYTDSGVLIRVLKVPNQIAWFCWDGNGTKIAIANDSLILFSLIKPKYIWTYFSDTLVYAFVTESEHHTINFWDLKKDTKNTKYVKNLIELVSFGQFCLIVAKVSEGQYIAILCNSIGSPIDNRMISIVPEFFCMNATHCFIASKNYIYLWKYRNNNIETNSVEILKKKFMKEIMFFVDDNPNINDNYKFDSFKPTKKATDPICAIYSNDHWLIIVCDSGRGYRFPLPHLGAGEKLSVGPKLYKVGLNSTGQCLWGVDENNIFALWDLEKSLIVDRKKVRGQKLDFEKKEVWSVAWSGDDIMSYAFMEKNKLSIMKNSESEEQIVFNGYLAEFSNYEVIGFNLEELMARPSDTFQVNDILVKFESKALKELKEMIKSKQPIQEIYKFVEKNPHKKMWTILSEHALLILDYPTAEKSMIHYNDYIGLSFIKRLKNIDDDQLKRAETYAFFQEYENAEEIYNIMERKDLIISMRIKLGHWEKVIVLVKESGYIQEDNLKVAYNNLGMQYYENNEYEKAEDLFKVTNNHEGLVNIWFKTENFDKASKFVNLIPEGTEFLVFMGEKFETYGLCDEAVNCYIRYGDVKKAIDTCVLMNKWNLAVELAEKNNFQQIEGLVNKFCNVLIEKNKKMDLVELYRKAHKHTEAAKMLIKIAEDLKSLNASPIILKKIYVIAALEVESFKTRLIDAQITQATQKTTLDTLITSDLSNVSDKALNNPWKGAEAYHFYMLCQSQLYQLNYLSALKTALRLVQYEKELDAKEVYRLIALAAFLNKSYKECSKAISRLENLSSLSTVERAKYSELAISLFTKIDPYNKYENPIRCPGKNCDNEITEFDIDCKNCGSNFSPCVISGQPIFEREYLKCKRCKHKSQKSEIVAKRVKFCALCHSILDLNKI